jgi:hypothetical protein
MATFWSPKVDRIRVPKGIKTGGRVKGTPNRATQTIRTRLAELNCDYVGYLAATVNNIVPCGVCRGTGKTKFQPSNSERFSGERTCQSCWGSKMERLQPKERSFAASELLQYCESKRKAIEHSGPEGGPIEHELSAKLANLLDLQTLLTVKEKLSA